MEALGVVALIGILSAVTILIVVDYLRSTTKLEYDGYAKSIFVASQNHLTMAEHEGYLGRSYFGVCEDSTKGIYRFVVQDGSELGLSEHPDLQAEDSILDLILPFGSVDETVRTGSYIIRYQKDPAQVLDVFYWNESGRYKYHYSDTDYNTNLLPNANDKDALRNYGDGSIIGYYGGADAKDARGEKLDAPQLHLINAEMLYVLVDNPVAGIDGASMKLVVRGMSSGNIVEFDLTGDDFDSYWDSSLSQFKVILDDITTDSTRSTTNHHFSSFCFDSDMIPGENITVYAVAYNDSAFTNIAYSAEQTTNSLFADFVEVEEDDDSFDAKPTIFISNIRHLENLDGMISNFNPSFDDSFDFSELDVKQTTDLDWNDFLQAINPEAPETVSISMNNATADPSTSGCFEPISPSYVLYYDGQNHIIRNLKVDTSSYGGLFGNPASLSVSNLMLEDPSITGATAGALAGRMQNGSVNNVLVCQTKDANPEVGVTATAGYAGGMIGEMTGSVEGSVAAIYVKSTALSGDSHGAGGLIGQSNGGSISGCYSAGFTVGASYESDQSSFTVSALDGSVGGLVGDAVGTTISYSYSTCSVYGNCAGGFVGTSDSEIKSCYSTGLVSGPSAEAGNPGLVLGAFAAKLSGASEAYVDDWFFSIITDPMGAVGYSEHALNSGIKAFDLDTLTYQNFVSSGEEEGKKRAPATPYDDTLVAYYQGNYNLRTVLQLGYVHPSMEDVLEDDFDDDDTDPTATEIVYYVDSHYGDWPAPEIMIINKGNDNP